MCSPQEPRPPAASAHRHAESSSLCSEEKDCCFKETHHRLTLLHSFSMYYRPRGVPLFCVSSLCVLSDIRRLQPEKKQAFSQSIRTPKNYCASIFKILHKVFVSDVIINCIRHNIQIIFTWVVLSNDLPRSVTKRKLKCVAIF